MKNKLLIGIISTSILLSSTSAYALTGHATVDFTGDDIVTAGDTFKITMNVKDVTGTNGGIESLNGNLAFNSDMIEYVSGKTANAPYLFQINEEISYKVSGLDFTFENGILENTTVYEFTFRALREGNTSITLANPQLTDTEDYVNTTVESKNIKIKVDRKEHKVEQVSKINEIENKSLIKIFNKILEKIMKIFK